MFRFQPSIDADDVTLREAVFQALGAASMCWSQTPRGIFQVEQAKEIGEALIAKIEQVEMGHYVGEDVR